jgi:hypothetical protein
MVGLHEISNEGMGVFEIDARTATEVSISEYYMQSIGEATLLHEVSVRMRSKGQSLQQEAAPTPLLPLLFLCRTRTTLLTLPVQS